MPDLRGGDRDGWYVDRRGKLWEGELARDVRELDARERARTEGPGPSPVVTAWGDWLATFRWDWWATLTFAKPRGPAAATRAFLAWIGAVRRGHDGRDVASPSAGFFLGHEVGQLGRLHLHCLVGGLDPTARRDEAWRWWFSRLGRAEVLPYDPARGAGWYVAKYVAKQLSEYLIEPPGPTCQLPLFPASRLPTTQPPAQVALPLRAGDTLRSATGSPTTGSTPPGSRPVTATPAVKPCSGRRGMRGSGGAGGAPRRTGS